MYYRELFAVWTEFGSAYNTMAGRYLFVFPFQITDVEMEVPRLVDDVSVLVFRRADVDERTVPVLQGEPLELVIFFDIKQSDCFYSPVVRVASYIDPFIVTCPAANDARGAIVYWGEDCLAPRLHIMDADPRVLVVSCPREGEFFPVGARLEGFAVAGVAADDLLDCPGCEVVVEDRVGPRYVAFGRIV